MRGGRGEGLGFDWGCNKERKRIEKVEGSGCWAAAFSQNPARMWVVAWGWCGGGTIAG